MLWNGFFTEKTMANCKILLVDDDQEDYQILKQVFSDLGADETLLYADSGIHAIEFLEHQYGLDETVPNMVVLDINMPIMDGPAVLRAMRKDPRFQHIPVVMYSTSINPSDEKQCVGLGAEYCISKPTRFDEIIQVGETLLAICEKRNPLVTPDIS